MANTQVTRFVPDVVKRILISVEEIDKRVQQLADEINEHYKDKEVVIVGILKGSFIFMADLSKKIRVSNVIDFMALSSYADGTSSSGNVRIIMDMRRNINGKHVVLIEDIVDTGFTLHFLLQILKLRNPASLECCVLLRKPKCLKVNEFPVRWVGFDVEPVFVVGYGLDFAEKYRTLPYIAELKEEAYKKS